MNYGIILLWLATALLGLGLLIYKRIVEPRNVALSTAGLEDDGFEYIFRDRSNQFVAFDNFGSVRLGNLLDREYYACSVAEIRDSRREWVSDGQNRFDEFILHIGDVERPIHSLKLRNNKQLADHEWAKLETVLSHSRYMLEQGSKASSFENQAAEEIKVLFVSSNPIDQSHLQLDEEVRGIAEKLRSSKYRDSVELISEWAARPTDLLRCLNDHSPTVVHFSGHGSVSDELILKGDDGNAKCVSKAAIVELFRIQTSAVKLVLFNACFSHIQAAEITKSVPATIGMNAAISDEAARVFSANFYSAIGFGKSIQESFEQAKVSLMLEGIPEEQTPQLFVGAGVRSENLFLVKSSRSGSDEVSDIRGDVMCD